MMFRHTVFIAAAVACVAFTATAQIPTGPSLLIDAKSLHDHLGDKDLVILTVGPQPGYAKEHIAGSRFVNLSDISTAPTRDPGVLALEMLPQGELLARLGKLGISNTSRIVVVADSEWDSPSTRVMLTLAYAGLGDRSKLLDGGMTAWRAAKYPVTAEVPGSGSGTVTTAQVPSIIVDAEYVTAHKNAPRVRLIDARDTEFYHGSANPTGTRLGGHVPGARNLPYLSVIDSTTNRFLPTAQLAQRFAAAGVTPGDTVVAYCHVGQQATLVLFAARLLGHPTKLYDGSFQDWSMRKLPTEGGNQ